MKQIANSGDHKFDHLVGGYPLDQPPARLSIDEPAYGYALCGARQRLVVWDERSFFLNLSQALASADSRTRALVLPIDNLRGIDSENLQRLRSLILRSRGTATPVVISCGTADSAQGCQV